MAQADISDRRDSARADYAPEGTDARPSLLATVKRTFTEFSEDNMTDWAAALTYYGLLSLFPALIALVSIIGLVADPATVTKNVTDIVTQLGPKSAADTFAGPIKSITANKSAAGILLVVSLAAALWSASGYVGASALLFERCTPSSGGVQWTNIRCRGTLRLAFGHCA